MALRYVELSSGLVAIYAVVLALLIGAVVLLLSGSNPLEAYGALLDGMFGSPTRIARGVGRSIPYVGAALAVVLASKAGLFNLGGEGQLLAGALAGAWVGTWSVLDGAPVIVALPIVLFAGSLAGYLWGALAGILKTATGAHEVITTIMLNRIMVLSTRFLVFSRAPVILLDLAGTTPHTRAMAESSQLPELVDGTELHAGLFIVLGLCVVVSFVLKRTTFGFQIRAQGTNPDAARAAGINATRLVVVVFGLSGALAGITGAAQVAGTEHYLSPGRFANIGFDAVAIALLGGYSAYGVIISGFIWGSALAGAPLMQLQAGVSIDIVRIIQALLLLFVTADQIVRAIFRLPESRDRETVSFSEGWSS
jgi:simple sugar transport system permease protein